MKKALALMLVLTLSLSLLAGCGGSPAASLAPDSGAQAAPAASQEPAPRFRRTPRRHGDPPESRRLRADGQPQAES